MERLPSVMYKIRCRVSGGVTGTRESFLKAGGVVQYFTDKSTAERAAAYGTSYMNGPYATAKFEYWAVECSTQEYLDVVSKLTEEVVDELPYVPGIIKEQK